MYLTGDSCNDLLTYETYVCIQKTESRPKTKLKTSFKELRR